MSALHIPELIGATVSLRPLTVDDAPALLVACQPAEHTFRWYPVYPGSEAAMQAWVEEALADHAAGHALPFAVLLRDSGRVVGSTRFGALSLAHRRAEIGWTWLAPEVRRSAVNTECKRLLMQHGFEQLQLNRIELKTDSLNQRSRAAILRIGATEEGLFRNHMVTHDGRIRHTVWYSVVREDWPRVRAHLDGLLTRH